MDYDNKLERVAVLGAAGKMGSGILLLTAIEMADLSLKPENRGLTFAIQAIDVSEEGLRRIGILVEEAVEIAGFGHAVGNITLRPSDPTELSTGKLAAEKAMEMAGITIGQVGTVETHDCFTIAGILGVEALGLAKKGEGPDYVIGGETSHAGEVPFNTTGGLIGWGHPTGATGVHMAVTLWEQLTGKAGNAQINIRQAKPFGLSLNMGGDDKTLVSIVYRHGE
jgi:acetyl-CoA C-acetyltransferase/acetyl-CoA acyltransferase